MSLAVRLAITLTVMAAALAGINLLVYRRVVAVFPLRLRARRALVVLLIVPFAGTVLFRGLGRFLPVGFGESISIATSAFEMAVIVASVLIGIVALGGRISRASRRLLRGAAPSGAEKSAGGSAAAKTESPQRGHESQNAAEIGCPPPAALRASAPPNSPAPPAKGGAANTDSAASTDSAPKPSSSATLPSSHDTPSPILTRRQLIEQAVVGSALVVGGTSTAYGALFGRHDYDLSTVSVPIPGLSKAADGFTLVQLSDIHLGQMVGEEEMRAAEELVRKAKGDIVVLTGDLVDHDPRYAERLGRLVRRLGDIKPVYAIPGNHDYYTGVDEVMGTVRKAGGNVLVNEARVLLGEKGGFVLAGLDDGRGEPRGGGPDLSRALATVRSDAPRIVLSHNPKTFLDNAGQVALQLSGHTHGGQVSVAIPAAELILRHGYIKGLYQNRGSHLYVNRGFGTAGPPVRVGAPPEVTRIVLVSG
jgi:predicted MPP superfamily phosphohydrolase